MSQPDLRAESFYEVCRALPGVTEGIKWGNDLVFSVGGKMFAAFQLPEGEPIGLKVEPALFEALIRQPGIKPAPYMAKLSWIKLEALDTLPAAEVADLLRDAHRLTAQKLTKKARLALGIDG